MFKKLFFRICLFLDYFIKSKDAHVLMYHSFLKEGVFFNVKKEAFSKQINFLLDHGYSFVKISELIDMVKNKKNLRKVIALTFDDGHKDFNSIVLPLLSEKNIKATLFWPTGVKENTLVTSGGVECELLDEHEVSTFSQNDLLEIGSHGITHAEFTKLSQDDLEEEITGPKSFLEKITKKSVFSIAYPRGKFNKEVVSLVKKYDYKGAVSVKEGSVSHKTDIFSIPRLSVDSSVDMVSFRAKLSLLYDIVSKWKKY